MRTQPTIDLNIRRCTTSNLCSNPCVSGSEAKPNMAVGEQLHEIISISIRETRVCSTKSMVNGQPCMPHWAACFRHRGNLKQFHMYIIICRNVRIQQDLKTINPDPWQLLPTKVGPSGGKNFQGWCPKNFSAVQPTLLRPQGFQCKTRLNHRWSGSNAK